MYKKIILKLTYKISYKLSQFLTLNPYLNYVYV